MPSGLNARLQPYFTELPTVVLSVDILKRRYKYPSQKVLGRFDVAVSPA